MKIMVTGGLGYIGSHAVVELLLSEHTVLIADNLENSQIDVLDAISQITKAKPEFEYIDIRSSGVLDECIARFGPDAVMHFAAKKDPRESIDNSLEYYETNISGTINLLRAIVRHGVSTLVFSSSAAVYGDTEMVPSPEDSPLKPLTPYARSKMMIEQVIQDVFTDQSETSACILRYFNPVGTHPSGCLCPYHPHNAPNLFPSLIRTVRSGSRKLTIHGNDLPTPDGTGIRDYVHVQDLAEGHVSALDYARSNVGAQIFNLGTGEGYSVQQVISEFRAAAGCDVSVCVGPRRSGDPFKSYADISKAKKHLNWEAKYGLREMLLSEWKAFVGNEGV